MNRLRMLIGGLFASGIALAAFHAPNALAAVVPAPAWNLQALSAPTNFAPGNSNGPDAYEVFLTNSGGKASIGSPITITDTLPAGLGVESLQLKTSRYPSKGFGSACNVSGSTVKTVTCVLKEGLPESVELARIEPSEQVLLSIDLTVPSSANSNVLTNQVEVEGGGAEAVAAEIQNEIDPECSLVRECAPTGFQEFRSAAVDAAGHPVTAASSHPYQYLTAFAVNLNPSPSGSALPFLPAGGDLKGIEVALPPGLIANPTTAERCSAQQFNTIRAGVGPGGVSTIFQNECPDSSALGVALIQQFEGTGKVGEQVAIYNMIPPRGMPAEFGIQPAFGVPVYIETAVRNGPEGLGVRAFVRNLQQAKRATSALLTFWGTPADPSHDPLRGQCAQAGGSCPAGIPARPSFRLPTSCENPLLTTAIFETWAQPATGASAGESEAAPVGCGEVDFSPTIEATPTTSVADSPAGLHFKLDLPQKSHEAQEGLAEADLRNATVSLPRGLALNPSAANGLAACSPAEIGLQSSVATSPIAFDEAPATCPDAAKVGKAEVDSPLLDHPLEGGVYLAQQEANPFGSLLALYIALEDPQTGVVIKLAGKVTPDPVTGQLTTTFTENPQVPFEELRFTFFEGARAPLRTPATCGSYATSAELVPWSAPAGASADPSYSFSIGSGPAGPCPTGALAPTLTAGLANPTAGTYSPFSLRVTRPDASGEFAALSSSPPAGLVAKLAGIPYCPEAAIAQAAARSHPGQGALESRSPSCPAASQVGTTTAGAGAGPSPFYTPGKVYLAGPYKGGPLSLVAIIPAVAGPFDLGVVVNRIAVLIDPETAQVTAQSEPLPTILSGIPLDVRDIRVNLDRAGFTLAPTSCEPKSVDATVQGTSGATATLSDRFQLGGCAALRFKPALSLKLNGGTRRAAHPALRAVLTYPKGAYANVAKASVALPHSEFLDQAHIRTICTRVQFAASACPKGAIYGKATATTPLLDKPLSGPVYLRSSSHPLPDLVVALHGQLDVVAVGRIDTKHGGIRVSFEGVPDAPVSKFVLNMQGGSKGLLVNSRNICAHTNLATARFTGQNTKVENFRPVLRDSCKGGKKK